jgi:molecular chaperone DnaJ
MAKDYYETLGVGKKASKDELKKAFHKMAHKYHPDKAGGNEAKFKEVNEAYQTLSDDTKRQQYDTYGHAGPGAAGGQYGQHGHAGFEGFGGGSGGFDGVDLGDIFGDFFGGGGRGGQQAERGGDISIDIEISFEESIYGAQRKVVLGKTSPCDICSGTGAKPGTKMKKCSTCGGKGKVTQMRKTFLGNFSTVATCETCHGLGDIPEERCKTCSGLGVLKKQEEIAINVPPGIRAGEMLRMSGRGEAVAHGIPGDLYIRIHVKPHAIYRREGNNLVMDLDVKFTDAILGATYAIKSLDGKSLDVKIPDGVKYGDILRLKEKGTPATNRSRAGDILITVRIKTPTKLSKKAQKLVEELKGEGV